LYPKNAASAKVDEMIREFRDVKEIVAETKLDRLQVLGRLARQGYKKYYITDAERRYLLWRRKAEDL
jgi:hypothetical protein